MMRLMEKYYTHNAGSAPGDSFLQVAKISSNQCCLDLLTDETIRGKFTLLVDRRANEYIKTWQYIILLLLTFFLRSNDIFLFLGSIIRSSAAYFLQVDPQRYKQTVRHANPGRRKSFTLHNKDNTIIWQKICGNYSVVVLVVVIPQGCQLRENRQQVGQPLGNQTLNAATD